LLYSLWLRDGDGPGLGVALLDEDGDIPRFENDRFVAAPSRRVRGGGLG
jgi:hypothetical protein